MMSTLPSPPWRRDSHQKASEISGAVQTATRHMNASASRYAPARQFLRDATHQDHVRLNRHPLLAGITTTDYPLANYHKILKTYFRFYGQVEAAIIDYLAQHPVSVASDGRCFDYAPRLKSPWLLEDLRYVQIDRATIPVQTVAINITSAPQLVGVLYTIEGSSLGGEVICQHISRNLGLTAAAGGRFFFGYGDQTLPLRRDFEAFMEFKLSAIEQREEAGKAARRTFLTMEAMLDAA